MRKKRLLSAVAAMVFALGAAAPLGASADKEEKEKVIKFKYDKDMVTETKEPALSFDGGEFKDYIHLTRDAGKGGISFQQDKDTAYQGVSLKVLADTSGISGYFNGSSYVKDENNNSLYPDAPKEDDVDNLNFVGIELHSEDFGMTTFDGCLFNFAYRLAAEDKEALLGGTVWVFGADDDNVRRSDSLQLTTNTTLDDNVTQYRNNALISIPEKANVTKLIFDIPAQNALKGEAVYLDNIFILLPDSAGDVYVANVDSYNPNAKVSEIVDEIKISKEKNDTAIADKKIEKQKDNTKKRIVILVTTIVILVAVGGTFFVIYLRKRFY